MSEFDRLANELEGRLEALVASTLERLRERAPAWVLETAVGPDQVSAYTAATLETQLRAFRRGTLPKSCPEVDAAAARTVVKIGELDVLINGYRSAQMTLWASWFCLIEDSPRLAGEARRELLSRGSDFFFRYADLITDFASAEASDQLETLQGNAEQRRFHAIRSLLESDPPSASTTVLDHELNQHHLGVLAWGEAGEDAARELATSLGRPLLLVAPIENTWWGWISGSRPFAGEEERLIARFSPAPPTRLALGLPAFGELGFRASHRQAQRARWLAEPGHSEMIRYADVALESLASENREEARTFVERELGGIGDESASSQRIRETLTAYFAAEYNAASAAATLGVHQQTVANRLRSAEERLGHPVGPRRLELEVALRLRAALARADS